MAGGPSTHEKRTGHGLIAVAAVLWITWGVLFVGTVTFRFDELFFRQSLHHGYVLNFEHELQAGPLVQLDRTVVVPDSPDQQLVALADADPFIACEIRSRTGTHTWLLVNGMSQSVEEFATFEAMIAAWSSATGGPTSPLVTPNSLRPVGGTVILISGVASFVFAVLFTVLGFLPVRRSGRSR